MGAALAVFVLGAAPVFAEITGVTFKTSRNVAFL
jgi:hypothetical protein